MNKLNLTIIQCTNPNCNREYKESTVTLYSGFSCPNCGWDKYIDIDIVLPKKRKDQIKVIDEYNERFN